MAVAEIPTQHVLGSEGSLFYPSTDTRPRKTGHHAGFLPSETLTSLLFEASSKDNYDRVNEERLNLQLYERVIALHLNSLALTGLNLVYIAKLDQVT